jgi:hypothetical protein
LGLRLGFSLGLRLGLNLGPRLGLSQWLRLGFEPGAEAGVESGPELRIFAEFLLTWSLMYEEDKTAAWAKKSSLGWSL